MAENIKNLSEGRKTYQNLSKKFAHLPENLFHGKNLQKENMFRYN